MSEKAEDDSIESHWLTWCRLCAKDDVGGNVKVNTGENANTWNSVLVMAIRKYFDVHMHLEDELSGVLCKECYTLISELIDFAEHVTKVQIVFETFRIARPDMKLDVEAVRLQYGLRDSDWTHIIKPVMESEQNAIKPADEEEVNVDPKEEFVETLENQEETTTTMLPIVPIEEIIIPSWNATDDTQDNAINRPRTRRKNGQALKAEFFPVQKLEINDESAIIAETDCASLPDEFDYQSESSSISTASSKEPESQPVEEPCSDLEGLDKTTKRRKLECKWCTKVYHNPASYHKHLRLGCRKKQQSKIDKSLYCAICKKTLSSAAALKQHQDGMHDNVKPYVCDHCGKQLKTITALKEHKLVHTEERPFACGVCRAAFKNKARLKVHYQIHEEPSYVCNVCGKKLQTRRTWNMHKLVHSEDRRFKCDVCDALFKRSKTLKRHLLSHTGLRPYVCNYCDKTFACNSNCRTHKVRKHPEELKQEEAGSFPARLKVPTLDELRVMSKMPSTKADETNVDSRA